MWGNPAVMTAMYICHWGVDYQLDDSCETYSVDEDFFIYSDFASQYGLSPTVPFPPNIPLKSTSSRHKFLHKTQEGALANIGHEKGKS